MRTFSYYDYDSAEQLTATDLREEAAKIAKQGHEVVSGGIRILEDGREMTERAEFVYSPYDGRIGIVWGSNADWCDCLNEDDIPNAINACLNDEDEWEARH